MKIHLFKLNRWDSQSPHEHAFTDASKTPENYCRNSYNDESGPWCYTTDPDTRWEYCSIPLCSDSGVRVKRFIYIYIRQPAKMLK